MKQITKQTEMQNVSQESSIIQRIIYVLFGIIELVLAFRLIFKLMGANAGNAFVHGIYNVSHPFVKIFEGIFSNATVCGTENITIFEPGTLISMLVIGIIAFILMTLMPKSNDSSKKTEYTEHNE